MKAFSNSRRGGFTLLETVIAIGVLAVLLTGFMVVFGPAAEGIRKSINVQQADRMASTLEQELITQRGTESTKFKTGFNKSLDWIQKANDPANAILVYQYRGDAAKAPRTDDGTLQPSLSFTGMAGKDFIVVPMVRRLSDSKFKEDLKAVEGAVYLVKCTQLVFNAGQLKLGTPGSIKNPKTDVAVTNINDPDDFPEAVIAFAADFYIMPAKVESYYTNTLPSKFTSFKNPVFSRNLAVRR